MKKLIVYPDYPAAKRNIGREMIRRTKAQLVVGNHYRLPRHWIGDQWFERGALSDLSFVLVRKYPEFALFRSSAGVNVCFRYMDLYSILRERNHVSEGLS